MLKTRSGARKHGGEYEYIHVYIYNYIYIYIWRWDINGLSLPEAFVVGTAKKIGNWWSQLARSFCGGYSQQNAKCIGVAIGYIGYITYTETYFV